MRSQAEPVNEREEAGTRIVEPACYLILPTLNEKRSHAKRHWLMWLSLLVSRESATGPSETVNGYRWRSKTAANALVFTHLFRDCKVFWIDASRGFP